MSGLDSITGIVMSNVKLPSGNADEIIPFLEQIKQLFQDSSLRIDSTKCRR